MHRLRAVPVGGRAGRRARGEGRERLRVPGRGRRAGPRNRGPDLRRVSRHTAGRAARPAGRCRHEARLDLGARPSAPPVPPTAPCCWTNHIVQSFDSTCSVGRWQRKQADLAEHRFDHPAIIVRGATDPGVDGRPASDDVDSGRHAPTGQCRTSISSMGKSLMFAVASVAPIPAAAAAIRQSA